MHRDSTLILRAGPNLVGYYLHTRPTDPSLADCANDQCTARELYSRRVQITRYCQFGCLNSVGGRLPVGELAGIQGGGCLNLIVCDLAEEVYYRNDSWRAGEIVIVILAGVKSVATMRVCTQTLHILLYNECCWDKFRIQ